MGYTASFLANETYGAADVNKIVERFAGMGVNPVLVDQENYSTTDLNLISNVITESGVLYNSNSCRVIKYTDSEFKILYGSAFFSDGSAIDVDSSGVILPILSGKNYIYFRKDNVSGVIEPISSNKAPSSGDIPLAEYQNSIMTDKRVFAKSKITGYGGAVTQNISSELDGTYTLSKAHPNWNEVAKIPLIRVDFNCVMMKCKGDYNSQYIRGGYFGEIKTPVNWSGCGMADGFSHSVINNDGPEPYIYASGGDYVQLNLDFSETGYVKVYLKSNRTRSYTLSNIVLTLC